MSTGESVNLHWQAGVDEQRVFRGRRRCFVFFSALTLLDLVCKDTCPIIASGHTLTNSSKEGLLKQKTKCFSYLHHRLAEIMF